MVRIAIGRAGRIRGLYNRRWLIRKIAAAVAGLSTSVMIHGP